MKREVARGVACVVAVSALLAGCSTTHVVGVSRLGRVDASADASGPAPAPTPTRAAASTSAPTAASTKPSGGDPSQNQTPSAMPPSSGSPSSAPVTRPPKGGVPHTFGFPSDYGVTVDDFCYWGTNHDGSESLYTGYVFHYRGVLNPRQLDFVAQDNFGHNTYGYVGGSWFNSGVYVHEEGVNVIGFTFSGQRIVLNVYLLPAVNGITDDNAANNRAEVTIYVPNQPAPGSNDQELRVNCVVDFGTTF